jgi:hypothetical protein
MVICGAVVGVVLLVYAIWWTLSPTGACSQLEIANKKAELLLKVLAAVCRRSLGKLSVRFWRNGKLDEQHLA